MKKDITIEEKSFCCIGCKTVYEILHQNDLCQYYDLEPYAGISLKGYKKTQYAILDDPEVSAKLIQFANEEKAKVAFYLPQIHCASCLWLLENLYRLNEHILHSRVNFLKKELYLTYDKKQITLRQIVELLASIGYTPEINYSQLTTVSSQKPASRILYYRLGVAGFAFGNIMLLSFPEYLGVEEVGVRHWFSYLNLILILPIVFFSGWPYLRSAWHGLRQLHLNIDVPISLGILTLWFRSSYEILMGIGPGYLDSLAGLVFFLLVGRWFQEKTYYRLSFDRDYKSYFPLAATLIEKGEETQRPLNRLEIDDQLLVKNGELIPADGILLSKKANIDYSFVSGEADPVQKNSGELLYAGGRQIGEGIRLKVTRKVGQSYFTQLWDEDIFKREQEEPTQQLADKVGKYFTWIVLAIAFTTLLYWINQDQSVAINAFTAVLIIACPCAVALAIPFTYGNVLRILARQGYFLKNTSVIEAWQKIHHIIFDKTGTLTNTSNFQVHFIGKELTDSEKAFIKTLAQQSTHPKSKAISHLFKNAPLLEIENFSEIIGEGLCGNILGNKILLGSKAMLLAKGVAIPDNQQGVFVAINGAIKGRFSIQHHHRTGLEQMMSYFNKSYQLSLLSGDNAREADRFKQLFKGDGKLNFNQSPKEKLNYIKRLQKKGEQVMMVGDGLNDAGALKQSDIGVVLSDKANNFNPACDVVLNAEQFDALPKVDTYLKKSKGLVFGAYLLAFIYNVIGLSFAVRGALSPVIAAILMPLSSLTIVLFGIVSSSILAHQLGLRNKGDKNHFLE